MSGSRWRAVAAVLALLLVSAVVGGVVLWHDRSDLADLKDRSSEEAAATEAAEEVVTSWLTYDYRSYDDDIAWIADDGTDSFQEEYTSAARKKVIRAGQLVSRGRVIASAATWEKGGQVKVVVFTDQTFTDKETRRSGKPAPHARSGVELTMVDEHGKWLVDELVQLQFE